LWTQHQVTFTPQFCLLERLTSETTPLGDLPHLFRTVENTKFYFSPIAGLSVGGANRLAQPLSTAVYNSENQLTQFGSAFPTYDANGNVTTDGTHTYTWDGRNHLVAIDSGATASFTYDAFGRRISKLHSAPRPIISMTAPTSFKS